MVKQTGTIPQYVSIRDILRERIETGQYPPGTAIPSEAELTAEFGVARVTVRSAIEGLIRDDLLLAMQGKGVFVVGKALDQTLDILEGFTRSMRGLNQQPKKIVLNRYDRAAGPYYARLFDLEEDDRIYYLKRVSEADAIPLAVEEIYLPAIVVPNFLSLNTDDFSMQELYSFYNIHVTHAEQKLNVITVDKNTAKFLNLQEGEPAFQLDMVTFSGKKVIERAISIVRSDICVFHSEFYK